MAAYTCSSTHAHGTGGTWVRSTRGEALFIGHDLRLGVPVSQCVPVVFLYSPRAVDAYIPQISPRVCVNRLGHLMKTKLIRLGHQLGHGVGHGIITGTPSGSATRERFSAPP